MLTWGEFKKLVEEQNVKDKDIIDSINFLGEYRPKVDIFRNNKVVIRGEKYEDNLLAL